MNDGGDYAPEWANEPPDLTHERDEHTDAGCLLREAVNGIRDHHGRDQLVTNGSDGGANDRSHIPVAGGRGLGANQEHDNANDGQSEAKVAQPEAELRLGLAVQPPRPPVHPLIGHEAAHLLADERSDDHTQELQAQLLGVQLELALQQLWHLDGRQNTTEQEHHCIRTCGNHNGWVADHGQGPDELIPCQRSRINSPQGKVFPLEG